jgi:signal transduction histidine kinase
MLTDSLVTFFLPSPVRADKLHPRYTEFYVVANACVLGFVLLIAGAGLMHYVQLSPFWFYLNAVLALGILGSMRLLGHYRVPMLLSTVGGLLIIYSAVRTTGMIFSINVNLVHMYLVFALLADKKWGWAAIFTCLGLLLYVYLHTPAVPVGVRWLGLTSNPLYAFCLHAFTTVFLGGAMAYGQYTEEQNRLQLQRLQQQQISLLDEAVRQRTDQLTTMRQAVAADFHDETGNVLAAITRQAALLEWQLDGQPEVLPIVQAIIDNSNRLYASSKDFLWDLNHESDNPEVLFAYLTAYGQQYYNQVDIAFSAEIITIQGRYQLPPLASLNLIYIFKEAMGNVIKHAGATEVTLELRQVGQQVTYGLQDNGCWAEPSADTAHYGLQNMRQRCRKHHFQFGLFTAPSGTRIEITVPMNTAFITV